MVSYVSQVQTDEVQEAQPHVNDVECQTVFETTPLPSPSPAHFLRRSCVGRPGLNDSLCVHKQERDEANERIENVPVCSVITMVVYVHVHTLYMYILKVLMDCSVHAL